MIVKLVVLGVPIMVEVSDDKGLPFLVRELEEHGVGHMLTGIEVEEPGAMGDVEIHYTVPSATGYLAAYIRNLYLLKAGIKVTQAQSEGWDLFEVDGRYQLHRIDSPDLDELGYSQPKFSTDADALIHVAMKAHFGSEYHRVALETIGTSVAQTLKEEGRKRATVSYSTDVKEIVDADLCASCRYCEYRPGGQSGCSKSWPGRQGFGGYFNDCGMFLKVEYVGQNHVHG